MTGLPKKLSDGAAVEDFLSSMELMYLETPECDRRLKNLAVFFAWQNLIELTNSKYFVSTSPFEIPSQLMKAIEYTVQGSWRSCI